ncbi:MAG: proline--tRNA ligase [Bacilli bacterium]|jgi:prolyl-tRNA synthetase|nr:proline--tRNA ligase [Bacilli bacterium]MCH4210988.1 proline--tRNA ligase [Bacilli bacterium]MCH4228501.1 proline--tRNA ligase [Bacilli bacterium]MCH4277783.1 proline--tRNA ligase [Bacilli bacterium]MCI2054953.1 proline--tRNA ligase [Bacilli bacterium]
MNMKNEAITARDVDFAQWYTDVCKKAELMDYSSVKGFIDYLPYGYAIWEEIQNYLNKRFKEKGSENVYLPMVIPSSLFNKEKEHVEGFAPETLVATYGGGKKLDDPLIIRPTSEILFSDMYKRLVSSYRDLPKRYNQWCSVVRWEKTTRPFLRGAEFLWQEGHCLFETEEEAEKNVKDMLQVYDDCGKDLLAIPFVKGKKTEHEKFAGALATYSIEALMHDGKALQSGTSHNLGQGFAKAFGISFQGRNNALEVPWQTSWGVSTRLLGAIIMVHGDDNGLVLPPLVAPIQVVIIPIRQQEEGVLEACKGIKDTLEKEGIRVKLDDDNSKTPGWKFSEYEMKGVPLRIEVGPRDLKEGQVVLAKRVTGEKKTGKIEEVESMIPSLLQEIHNDMYKKALDFLNSHISDVDNLDDLKKALDKGGYARMAFCGSAECELKIKEITNGGTTRCIYKESAPEGSVCPVCGKPNTMVVYFAKAY